MRKTNGTKNESGGVVMAIYKCRICGFVYDEEKEEKPVSELTACPVCKQPEANLQPGAPAAEEAPQKAWTGTGP